ncbi:MAG: hypothetical protein ACLPSL_12025, partial [Smithella sp.]
TCCEKMTTKTSVASLRSTGLVSTGINGRFHLEHVADFTGIKILIRFQKFCWQNLADSSKGSSHNHQ